MAGLGGWYARRWRKRAAAGGGQRGGRVAVKALVVDSLGPQGALSWREHDEPKLAPGSVLVKVAAVAVDWADVMQAQGRYPGGPVPPFVSGSGFAGTVTDSDIARLPAGTAVFGMHPDAKLLWGSLAPGADPGGAAAEIICVKDGMVFPTPVNLSHVEAAGIIGQFVTAYAAVRVFGRAGPGDKVLVHAGAGAFGSAAIQLCRAAGVTTVIGTAGSPAKLEFMAGIGASHAINYNAEPFAGRVTAIAGGGVDLIIDSVGGDTLAASFDCIAPFGRIVSVGASSGKGTSRLRLHTLLTKSISVAGLELGVMIRDPALFNATVTELSGQFERGELTSIVGAVFPVTDAAAAHAHLTSRANTGRTVLTLP